jgi:serine/threonine protein kinase
VQWAPFEWRAGGGKRAQVHRDIKGGNILVEKSGRIKLADFGMAKQMVEKMSLTRSFKGSAFWMAPEVNAVSAYPPSVPRLLTRAHMPAAGRVCTDVSDAR